MAQLRRRRREHALLAARPDRRLELRAARDRLALPDRQLRPRAGVQARRNPGDGRGRRLRHRGDAAGGGRARRRDRRAALDAPRGRGGAGRGVAAPPVRPRPGVLERRRRGARPLRDDRLPPRGARRPHRGRTWADFGAGGAVDLKAAAVVGDGRPIDLATGPIGTNAAPTVARDVVIVGGTFADGAAPQTHNNVKGLVQAFDVRTRRAALDVPHRAPPRRVRRRHLARRLVGQQRQQRRLDADLGRPRAGPRLPAGRDADRRLLRRPPPGRQPLRGEPGRRRSRDRRAALALPARPPSAVGLRHGEPLDPGRHHGRRAGRSRPSRSRGSRHFSTSSTG